VYAFLYAVAATWGCFRLTAVSQRYFVSGRIASYLLHYSELAQNEEFSGFRWCVCQNEPLICQGHTGGTIKMFLAVPRTPSSASVSLWFVEVPFSHPAFTAVTQNHGSSEIDAGVNSGTTGQDFLRMTRATQGQAGLRFAAFKNLGKDWCRKHRRWLCSPTDSPIGTVWSSRASVDDFAARDLMSDYYRRLLYQPVTSTCCSPFTALMY
jgi:hypothetical protein